MDMNILFGALLKLRRDAVHKQLKIELGFSLTDQCPFFARFERGVWQVFSYRFPNGKQVE